MIATAIVGDVVDRTIGEVAKARAVLGHILADLHVATDLKGAEAALDAVSELLQLPLVCWVPDTSHPYDAPEIYDHARAHGWPDELLKLWRARHAALKMPLYIRCRFEHLPFIASLAERRPPGPSRVSPEQARITAIIKELGVTTFLVVPLHLSKGQVAMIVWAGTRSDHELGAMTKGLEGDLLAIGYHFMHVARHNLGSDTRVADEHSRLTPREWDCVRTLAQGYREAEIAKLMGISKVTVRFHLDNVVHKFGCRTRTQAVALLAQLGLLGPIGP